MRIIFLLLSFISLSVSGQCLKADIIFLLDWSASEDSNRVYIPVAAYDFAKTLNIGPSAVKIGVIPFNTGPLASQCLVPSGDKDVIEKHILSMISTWPHGGTNFTSSMALAEIYFEESEKERGEPVMRLLFLISDGNEDILARDSTMVFVSRLKRGGTLIWCISTPGEFLMELDREREYLKAISSGAAAGYYVEEYYAHIKEELMRLELCP